MTITQFTKALPVIGLLLLTACTYGSANVKVSPTAHQTFQLDEPYQMIYTKVARRANACWGNSTGSLSYTTNLYTAIELGEIIVGNSFGTFLVVEIRPSDQDKTVMDIYAGTRPWNKAIKRVHSWATDQPEGKCAQGN